MGSFNSDIVYFCLETCTKPWFVRNMFDRYFLTREANLHNLFRRILNIHHKLPHNLLFCVSPKYDPPSLIISTASATIDLTMSPAGSTFLMLPATWPIR